MLWVGGALYSAANHQASKDIIPSCSPIRHWTDLHHLILLKINTKKQKTWALMLLLGGYMEICCHASVGGTSVCQDVQNLKATTPHIAVETPGRVFDILIHLLKGWQIRCWVIVVRITVT